MSNHSPIFLCQNAESGKHLLFGSEIDIMEKKIIEEMKELIYKEKRTGASHGKI